MKIELFNPYYNQCEFIDYFEIFLCFAINVVDNTSNADWVRTISVNKYGKVGIGDTTPSEKLGDMSAGVDYIQIIPYLIKSNQELHARIQQLEQQLNISS